MDEVEDSQPVTAVAVKDEFEPPILIDKELAGKLVFSGQKSNGRYRRVARLVALFCAVGFFSGLLNVPGYEALFAGLLFGWLGGYIKTRAVSIAYQNRQFDHVNKLLPGALGWTGLSALSYAQYLKCLQVQNSVLIVEGRYTEFEALTRFLWGVTEKYSKIGLAPKNWTVASNLGAALLLQHKYAEAAVIFEENLPMARKKEHQLTLLYNLTYCLIFTKEFERAEKFLYQASDLHGKNIDNLMGMRLQFLSAFLQIERDELDSAELSVQHASELSIKFKQPDDFRGYCNGAMGDIRRRQKRFDESELYYRNAIDIFSSADNPSYLDLAVMHRQFAKTLTDAGKTTEAAEHTMRAHIAYDFYIERETDTVNRIRHRLNSPVPIKGSIELTTLSSRVKAIEAIGVSPSALSG